jgi:hypothetical protein
MRVVDFLVVEGQPAALAALGTNAQWGYCD